MAILKEHIPFYRELFKIKNFFREPFLMFGYQDIFGIDLPDDFNYKDVKQLLKARGIKHIKSIDLFDGRADLKYDMNFPIPAIEHENYNVLLDIGSLEHVFDTKQCLENCLRLVKVNGLYVLHAPVNGYFSHGLHVFNPEGLENSLLSNNYEVIYKKYSTRSGRVIRDPSIKADVLMWIVARKIKSIDKFTIPQQGYWKECYQAGGINQKET